MNPSTKLATGLALACTWTTAAQADDFHLGFTANQNIDNVRIYTYYVPAGGVQGSANRPDETLSPVYAPMARANASAIQAALGSKDLR